ncbi:unnamed protein product [Brassica rapa]|uniref:Uncharacterized protein n=1 Tax=Brassica campestris TaxID=3711 RepID=A0A8D9CUD4_BRACM|nr:unnamed protein product [Brassica rapa]
MFLCLRIYLTRCFIYYISTSIQKKPNFLVMQTTSVSSQDDSDDDLETQKQHNRNLADVEHGRRCPVEEVNPILTSFPTI